MSGFELNIYLQRPYSLFIGLQSINVAPVLVHVISLTVSDLLCVDFHFTKGHLSGSVFRLLDDDISTRRSAWIALQVVLCSVNCWPGILPTQSIAVPLWRGSCVYHSDKKEVEAINYTEILGCNRNLKSYNFPNFILKNWHKIL